MDGMTIIGDGVINNQAAFANDLQFADLNGDNKTDIILNDLNGTIKVWIMDGGSISQSAAYGGQTGWRVAAIGSLDEDNNQDLVLQHDNGGIKFWLRPRHCEGVIGRDERQG